MSYINTFPDLCLTSIANAGNTKTADTPGSNAQTDGPSK